MNWERLQEKLEQILDVQFQMRTFSDHQWEQAFHSMTNAETSKKDTVLDGKAYWIVAREPGKVHVLLVDELSMTETEKQLIAMSIELANQMEVKPRMRKIDEEEQLALSIQEWIEDALLQGDYDRELPPSLSSLPALQGNRIPFLLYDRFTANQSVSFRELKKLLESFFEEEVLLVPLKDREWLIFSSDQVIHASGLEDRFHDASESVEDLLESLSSGLHEMIVTEWLGECMLSTDYPIVPSKALLATVQRLREAVSLGTTFHLGSSIHFPWRLHLERLLFRMSEQDKLDFLEQILKRSDYLTDAEMLPTLEHFFALDCNVSDTAKQLYIHRNTLLYRLDKFKQETGLDVRNFSDAVLVRIALLLYKVTKR